MRAIEGSSSTPGHKAIESRMLSPSIILPLFLALASLSSLLTEPTSAKAVIFLTSWIFNLIPTMYYTLYT